VYSLSRLRLFVVSLLLFGSTISCAGTANISPRPDPLAANSPANTSYFLENAWIKLENGRAAWQTAPGSASDTRVELWGDAVHGDVTFDGDTDALIFLLYEGGGSGTFFYLAAALSEKGQYRGTNAIWLGDRIGPPAARVRNGVITVEYLDRRPDEPMTAAPGFLRTRFFMLDGSTLLEITPAADETLYQGWLTIGHEVRSFSPCDENAALWLLGQSSAIEASIAAYRKTMADFPPYTPVFAALSGRKTASPVEGFGADYKGALYVSRLIHVWPQGNCRSDFILLDSPLPGAPVTSPLTIKGRARGTWFFEGDFPLLLLDAQGQQIGVSYATAKGEWMTENFVDFEGILTFTGSFSGQGGTLVLKKDNPTGLQQFDDAMEIPVYFK
jgi:hypothetical protein